MYPLTVCNGNISFTFDRISDFCANAISPKRYRKLVKAMLLLFNRNLIKCFDIKDTYASHILFMVIKRKQKNKITIELEVENTFMWDFLLHAQSLLFIKSLLFLYLIRKTGQPIGVFKIHIQLCFMLVKRLRTFIFF